MSEKILWPLSQIKEILLNPGREDIIKDWEFRSKLLRTAEMAGGTNKSKGKRCYRLGEIFITGEATALAMRTNIKR